MSSLFITLDQRLVDRFGNEVDRQTASAMAEVMVWVPSEQVTLLEVKIPTRNTTELEQSLPYAIEEELLEDIEQLHIAWNITPREVPLRVAVVSKELMHSWLRLIKPLRLPGFQLVPDVFALPWNSNTPSMWVTPERSILRCGSFAGFSGTPDTVEAFVRINKLDPLRYYPDDNAQARLVQEETAQPQPAAKDTVAGRQTTATGQQAGPAQYPALPVYEPQKEDEYINLLQGDFVAGAAFSRVLRRSAAPLLGLALIALLVLGHQVAQYLVLRKEVNHFDNLVVTRAQEILPGYKAGQPLRLLTERQVVNQRAELLRREKSSWAVFEQAIPLLRNCNNCVFDRLAVDNTSIEISLSSYSSLEGMESQLKSLKGFKVDTDMSSVKIDDNTYSTLSLTLNLEQE